MHKIAIMLDSMANIAVRSGRHCVHSWFDNRKIRNSARVSIYFYNSFVFASENQNRFILQTT